MVDFFKRFGDMSKLLHITTRWWRPLTGWACTVNAWVILVILPLQGVHLKAEELYAMLAFNGLVVGLRGWEKMRANTTNTSEYPMG